MKFHCVFLMYISISANDKDSIGKINHKILSGFNGIHKKKQENIPFSVCGFFSVQQLTVQSDCGLDSANAVFWYAFVSTKIGFLQFFNGQCHLYGIHWVFRFLHNISFAWYYHFACILNVVFQQLDREKK